MKTVCECGHEIEYSEKDIKLAHRLLCGDATSEDDIRKLMGKEEAEMVFTDPPYNVAYRGGHANKNQPKRKAIENDDMTAAAFEDFLTKSITNAMKVCRGAFYICMSSKELASLKQTFEKAGGHWQSFIIWVKSHFTLSRSDYQQLYEPILYGWNGTRKHHYFIDDRSQGNVWYEISKKAKYENGKTLISMGGIKIEIDGKVTGRILRGTRRLDIWNHDKPARSDEHPTMKPVALCIEAIQNSSHRGGIILDNFGGSGSTLIGCEKAERKCRMMELDPGYCQVIVDRWEEYTGLKAIKLK